MAASLFAKFLARSLCAVFALGAVALVVAFGPSELRAVGLSNVAGLLVEGDRIRPATMKAVVDVAMDVPMTGLCFPHVTRAASVVLFVEAQARVDRGDFDDAAPVRKRLGELNERTLACAPGSGFDWTLRYWYEAVVRVDQQAAFRSILMSYRTAPNEGWIMVRRLPFLLAAFDVAPPALRRHMLDDFRRVAQAGSVVDVVDIYSRDRKSVV